MSDEQIWEFATNEENRTRRFAAKQAERGKPVAEELRLIADLFRDVAQRHKVSA
jgi:hypothetical protein